MTSSRSRHCKETMESKALPLNGPPSLLPSPGSDWLEINPCPPRGWWYIAAGSLPAHLSEWRGAQNAPKATPKAGYVLHFPLLKKSCTPILNTSKNYEILKGDYGNKNKKSSWRTRSSQLVLKQSAL